MPARLRIYIVLFVSVFFIHSFVFAATSISFSNNPQTIDQSQDFSVDVLLLCPGCTSDSYIRGVFYPSGTSYFGYTQNNAGTWVNAAGGSCTEYFKITASELVEGSWSGKIKVKPDIESFYYNNPGDYLFKVGRYTGGCGSPTWSTETTITIIGPTNSPTPTTASTPVPTQTQTPTSSATPMPSPTSKPISTSTPTKKIITPTETKAEESMVLGVTPSITVDEDVLGTQSSAFGNNKNYIIALLFTSIGLALLGAVLIIKNRLYSKHA